jgi:hypothetical protein
MFGVCVGIGSLSDLVVRSAVAWLARGASSDARLQLTVESGPHAIRIRNLTDEAWTACVVTVDGGYTSPPTTIEPRGRATLPYGVFVSDAQPLGGQDGFGRAFRSTLVDCTDHQHRREVAVLR